MNGYHYVEYKGVKSFKDPQYYGKANFEKWDKVYNLSKYNINTNDPNKVRWFAVMEIDGVCGAIAKTYTALQETYGRPSGVLKWDKCHWRGECNLGIQTDQRLISH